MPMEQFAILMALKTVSRQCPVKSQETFRNIELSSLKYAMNTLGITHEVLLSWVFIILWSLDFP